MQKVKIESTKAVIVTMGSSNVKELKEASEKHGVEIPDVKYQVILTEGIYECYHQLVGYGKIEYSFGIPESALDQEDGPFASDLDGKILESRVNRMILNNLDNMHWGNIVTEYLAENGEEMIKNDIRKGEETMSKENVVKIESTKAVIVTMSSSNVKELKEASEKYSIEIPDVKYYVILTEGVYECYHQLVGYGNMEYAFGIPESALDQEDSSFASDLDGKVLESRVNRMILDNLDNMHWGNILTEYLSEEGIEYAS